MKRLTWKAGKMRSDGHHDGRLDGSSACGAVKARSLEIESRIQAKYEEDGMKWCA